MSKNLSNSARAGHIVFVRLEWEARALFPLFPLVAVVLFQVIPYSRRRRGKNDAMLLANNESCQLLFVLPGILHDRKALPLHPSWRAIQIGGNNQPRRLNQFEIVGLATATPRRIRWTDTAHILDVSGEIVRVGALVLALWAGEKAFGIAYHRYLPCAKIDLTFALVDELLMRS